MSTSEDQAVQGLAVRVTKLEEMITHLQRDTDDLSQAVLQVHNRMDTLATECSRLRRLLAARLEGPEEGRE
jgi:hypothetical protein